jgi:tRNA G26 N,N-dimethylase Trm1
MRPEAHQARTHHRMHRINCAGLTATCDATLYGTTTEAVLGRYLVHADQRHRHEDIDLKDVLRAITHSATALARAPQ